MKIILIHQSFISPQEAGGTRHYELVRHLVQAGHQVVIVASSLNYLTGEKVIASNGLVKEQNLEGIRILRAYTLPTLHRSFVWRVISFLSFMCTSVLACWKAGRSDVIMTTSPPIFQTLSGWLIAQLRRRPMLLEIRDLWPEFAIDMGILTNPVLIFIARKVELFLYRQADHILVNSPAYLDYLISKGVPKYKITTIPNGVDPDLFSPDAKGTSIREDWCIADKFVVTYAGAMGIANNLDIVLRAAKRLSDEPKIHFLLVGDGKERAHLIQMAQSLNLSNVTFTGPLRKTQMPDILAASDVCLAVLQNIPMFKTTYPNKVFDYMAAGKPTLLAIDGVIRQVIEASNGGIFIPPGNDQKIAEAVQYVFQNPQKVKEMGKMARAYVVKHFNRNYQANQFIDLMDSITNPIERRPPP